MVGIEKAATQAFYSIGAALIDVARANELAKLVFLEFSELFRDKVSFSAGKRVVDLLAVRTGVMAVSEAV